jgi:hypothetical protein
MCGVGGNSNQQPEREYGSLTRNTGGFGIEEKQCRS